MWGSTNWKGQQDAVKNGSAYLSLFRRAIAAGTDIDNFSARCLSQASCIAPHSDSYSFITRWLSSTSSHPSLRPFCLFLTPIAYPPPAAKFPPALRVLAMSGTWGEPWTHNPNTPQINYVLYLAEKSDFARAPISAILYGTPIHRSPTWAHSVCYDPII